MSSLMVRFLDLLKALVTQLLVCWKFCYSKHSFCLIFQQICLPLRQDSCDLLQLAIATYQWERRSLRGFQLQLELQRYRTLGRYQLWQTASFCMWIIVKEYLVDPIGWPTVMAGSDHYFHRISFQSLTLLIIYSNENNDHYCRYCGAGRVDHCDTYLTIVKIINYLLISIIIIN